MGEELELVNKYEQMGFLENVEEVKKEKLSELFENFTKFLLKIGEEKLLWGKCDFAIIFIPLIRKLYVEYDETNYKKVYIEFKNWYNLDGVEWEVIKKDIDVFDFISLYLEYYKLKN